MLLVSLLKFVCGGGGGGLSVLFMMGLDIAKNLRRRRTRFYDVFQNKLREVLLDKA